MSGGGQGFGTDNLLLAAGVVSFCIVMVGAFASSEASILAANRLRIQQLAERGDKRAQAFCELRDNEDKMFATILAVENMFIIFAASFGVSSAENILGPDHRIWLGVASIATLGLIPFLLEFLIVLFGEITPKTFAARHSTRTALLVSRPLSWVVKFLYPLIRYAFVIPSRLIIRGLDRMFGSKDDQPSITEEELRMIIDRSSQEGVLDIEERDLLHNVFEFGDTLVSQVMTSRTQIVAFDISTPAAEALPEMLASGFSRYPVYAESIDGIKGLVHIKDLFKAHYSQELGPDATLEAFVQPTLFVPENKHVIDLLELMQANQVRTVIVADEFGGTEGLVSLRDMMHEIFGELEQAHPDARPIQQPTPGIYRVQGHTSIYDLDEELGLTLPEGKYQTIAGFVLDQLGHIPVAGEACSFGGWDIIVTGVIGPKIVEVELRERQKLTGELALPEGMTAENGR
ncbi:MAG TPA: hemolysin family protein [Candidatus Obscuribacterales bacterium]